MPLPPPRDPGPADGWPTERIPWWDALGRMHPDGRPVLLVLRHFGRRPVAVVEGGGRVQADESGMIEVRKRRTVPFAACPNLDQCEHPLSAHAVVDPLQAPVCAAPGCGCGRS